MSCIINKGFCYYFIKGNAMRIFEVVLFLAIFSFPQNTVCQIQHWKNFTNTLLINDITQQGDALWLGTSGGLIRFDLNNNSMIFYNKGNSGLPGNNILSLEAKGSRLWVGTDRGLAKFEYNEWTVFKTSNSLLPDNYVNKITLEGNTVYVGTYNGLAVFNGANFWQVYTASNSVLPANNITDIDIDSDENIWLCIKDWSGGFCGAGRFQPNNWQELMTDNNPVLFIDSSGNKWVGTSYSGVHKYDVSGALTVYDGFMTDCITDIDEDSNGNIWVTCNDLWDVSKGGLLRFDGSSWLNYTSNNSGLVHEKLRMLFVDSEDQIWLSSMQPWNGFIEDGFGLIKYDQQSFSFFSTAGNPIPKQSIDNIVADKNGKIWIDVNYDISAQIGGGLLNYDGSDWHEVNTNNTGLPVSNVTGLSFDLNNHIWATGYHMTNSGVIDDGGVMEYVSSDWNYYTPYNSALPNQVARSIACDKKGNKWVAVNDALCKIDSNNQWTVFTMQNSNLPTNNINLIKTDPDDALWISSGSKLYKYDETIWNTIDLPLESGSIIDFEFDSSGVIWFAMMPAAYGPPQSPYYKGGGVLRYDGLFTLFDTTNAQIPSVYVYAVEIDGNQHVWIGTIAGLCKFDGSLFTVYNEENSGLASNSISSLCAKNNGDIWIGHNLGYGISVYNENGFTDESGNLNDALSVFPNPMTDYVVVELPQTSVQSIQQISLYSLSGQEVQCPYILTSKGFALLRGNLENGLYILNVQTDLKSYQAKLIVQ